MWRCAVFLYRIYECNRCWHWCYYSCCCYVVAFVFIPYRKTNAAIPICAEKREGERETERKRTHSVVPMVFSYFQICHILISINLSMEWRNDICQCRHVSNLIFSAFSMWFVQNVNFLPHFQYMLSHCCSVPMCSSIPQYDDNYFFFLLIAHVELYKFNCIVRTSTWIQISECLNTRHAKPAEVINKYVNETSWFFNANSLLSKRIF